MEQIEKKESEWKNVLAIASFVLGVILALLWFHATFFTYVVLEKMGHVGSVAVLVLPPLGIVAGIMGLKSKKRTFAIVGLSLCLLVSMFILSIAMLIGK